jgi:hypothetical protein
MTQAHSRNGLRWIAGAAALAAILAFWLGCSSERKSRPSDEIVVSDAPAPVTAPAQQTFASPDEAVQALVGALRPYEPARARAILGPDADAILSSGDKVADAQQIDSFLSAYDAKHRVVMEDDGAATLMAGNDDWPMPVPIVREGNSWRFDSESGKDEILARRVGRNELSTIQTCRAIVDAQDDYAEMDPMRKGGTTYARKFFSDPGLRNGLYWEAQPGEPESPLGELVADAVLESYTAPTAALRTPQPFHGYFYRMLTAQGPSAPGGARSYIEGDRLTGGFAAVAWPAEYGNSGIMTFIMNQNGILYQKDLGPNTTTTAKEMTEFDPGEGWDVVP